MTGRYHRPRKWSWFTVRPAYILFMIRELTSVFIAAYLVLLLVFLSKLGSGVDAFVGLLQTLKSPLWMVLHAIALIAALWHSITWFNLTPRAMPVFLGEKRVGDPLVAWGMGFAPWIVVSLLIVWAVT